MTYHKQVTSTNVNSQEEGLFKSLVPVIRGKYVSCEQSHIKGKSDFFCVYLFGIICILLMGKILWPTRIFWLTTCSYPGEELSIEAWEALGVNSGQEKLKGDIARSGEMKTYT